MNDRAQHSRRVFFMKMAVLLMALSASSLQYPYLATC